jgi:hypothetical protein
MRQIRGKRSGGDAPGNSVGTNPRIIIREPGGLSGSEGNESSYIGRQRGLELRNIISSHPHKNRTWAQDRIHIIPKREIGTSVQGQFGTDRMNKTMTRNICLPSKLGSDKPVLYNCK